MKYKYGEFSQDQIREIKKMMRKKIFFLLLCADGSLGEQYKNIDIATAIESLLTELDGLNDLLMNPPEIITAMGILVSAKKELLKENYNFGVFRKLILGAGVEVEKIKEE